MIKKLIELKITEQNIKLHKFLQILSQGNTWLELF